MFLSFFASPAKADVYTVTGASDLYFEITELQQFTVRTYAQQYGIDSMLWLYDSNNQLLSANDDWFGLDSFIQMNLQPGNYRLRTGVCCGDPNAWRGGSYVVETNVAPASISTGSTTTTSTSTSTYTTTTTTPLPENSNWSMVNEGNQFELLAPEGFIFSEILFASYGTPVGSYGQWQLGNCHASNSLEIISNVAIGQSFFSISATNDIFGDPCGGTPKRLAVTALYAPAPSTTTTSTTTTTTTTTLPPTTTTQEPTTTTTEASTTTTTQPIVETTILPTTVPESTTTSELPTTTIIPETTTTELTTTTTSTTLAPTPKTTTSVARTTIPEPTTTTTSTTIPATTTSTAFINTTTTSQAPKPIENVIAEASTPEELKNVINNVDLSTINSSELVSIIDNTAIDELNGSEIQEVFAEINFDEFSKTELKEIALTLSQASDKVKEAFEEEIDIYGSGAFDEYVPTGSAVSVGTRRVIVAAAAALSTVSISTSSTSTSGGGSRRK